MDVAHKSQSANEKGGRLTAAAINTNQGRFARLSRCVATRLRRWIVNPIGQQNVPDVRRIRREVILASSMYVLKCQWFRALQNHACSISWFSADAIEHNGCGRERFGVWASRHVGLGSRTPSSSHSQMRQTSYDPYASLKTWNRHAAEGYRTSSWMFNAPQLAQSERSSHSKVSPHSWQAPDIEMCMTVPFASRSEQPVASRSSFIALALLCRRASPKAFRSILCRGARRKTLWHFSQGGDLWKMAVAPVVTSTSYHGRFTVAWLHWQFRADWIKSGMNLGGLTRSSSRREPAREIKIYTAARGLQRALRPRLYFRCVRAPAQKWARCPRAPGATESARLRVRAIGRSVHASSHDEPAGTFRTNSTPRIRHRPRWRQRWCPVEHERQRKQQR